MKIFYTLTLLLMSLSLIKAQNVSFTNQSTQMGSIVGYSYEDCIVDMNNDQLDDIVRVTSEGIYIDYQQTNGTFSQTHFDLDLQVLPSWSMCAGDLNGDKYNDLLLASGSRVSFVYSNADGTEYTEVYHPEYIFSQRSTMADIDNDGNLDAFVCHDVDQSHPYRNDGTGAMTLDQSLIATADLAGNYAALWVDYDNDGDSDLYITKCRQGSSSGDIERTNLMYRDNGDGTYTEVAEEIGMADNAQSWTTVFEDFDNDGDFDAFIVNHDFQNRFMINDGLGNFTDIIETTGINEVDLGAWENAAGDFNNDGFVDIFSELQNALYLNNGDLTFTPQNLPIDNGALGDANNDGFLDVVSNGALWINDGNTNNWVKISTEGIVSNPSGIGARVECHGEWGMQIREVRSTQSFSPMHSLNTHFGIGQATAIDSIVVKWPSGARTVLDNPPINQAHHMIELDCLLSGTYEATPLGSTEICPGGEVQIEGPAGFSSYMWSNGDIGQTITATMPGIYRVVVQDDEGCNAISTSVSVSYISEPEVSFTYEGDLLSCQADEVILTAFGSDNYVWSTGEVGASITVEQTGGYFVTTDSICSSGMISSEMVHFDKVIPDLPMNIEVDFDQMMGSTATLSAEGENIKWYADQITTAPLHEGNEYVTAPITGATTFYVSSTKGADAVEELGGKLNNAGNGGIPSTGAYSLFNVDESFRLKTVTVYVIPSGSTSSRTIELYDGDDVLLETMETGVLEEGPNVVTLNWIIPTGEAMSLRCPQNNLFRNSDGVEYPYEIGTFGELYTSFYGDNFYYYFYDWRVEQLSVSCESERLPVEVGLVNVNDLPNIESFAVFPNPVKDVCSFAFVASQNGEMNYTLMNNLGQQVVTSQSLNYTTGDNQQSIDVAHLPSGIYTLQVMIEDKVSSQKIVIE